MNAQYLPPWFQSLAVSGATQVRAFLACNAVKTTYAVQDLEICSKSGQTTPSSPAACRPYLPKIWAQDRNGLKETGIPREITFATKPVIALQQIRKTLEKEATKAPVLADAAYGNDGQFREGLTELGLEYVVGVQKSMTVWRAGKAPLPAKRWKRIDSKKLATPGQTTSTDFPETTGGVLATQLLETDGGRSPRGPSAVTMWSRTQSAFVDENDATPASARFFLVPARPSSSN